MAPTDIIEDHPVFFYSDGTHFFRAGRYLFKVHASVLSQKSETFQDMFMAHTELGSVPVGDGHTKDEPVVLPVSEAAFELFLCVCYGKWRPDINKIPTDVLFQLLELSRMYMSNDVREFTIKEIDSRRTSIRPCSLISISMEHNIEKLFKYGFQRLVKARLDDLTDNEYTMMDSRMWAAVLKAQATIEMHRRIVACEPPPMAHATGCTDSEKCRLDWELVWWNGMGRFLLDGRNPQPWKNAVQRFEEITEIGHVSLPCWRSMITLLRAGTPTQQEDVYLDRVSRKWAQIVLTSTS